MENPSHPCAIWRPRNFIWRGSNCIFIKLEGVAVKFLRGGLSKCYFYKVQGGFYKINWVWLDYILILMKFEDFFIKLPSLLNNQSHPCFRSFKDVTNNQPQPCLLYNAEFMWRHTFTCSNMPNILVLLYHWHAPFLGLSCFFNF